MLLPPLLLAASIVTRCDAARALPVGPGPDCEKVAVEAVLHVDAHDPRQI